MAVNFQSGLNLVKRAIEEKAHEKREEVAELLKDNVQRSLEGSRHGRRYRIPGTDRVYTASAPGEYPAEMTGNLKASIQAKALDVAAVVGTNWNLAAAVEEARPFLEPVARESEAEIVRRLQGPWGIRP